METEKMLLSQKEAAAKLSVCQKSLWNYTTPRGDIPAVRFGSRVLYDPKDLAAWIDAQKTLSRGEQFDLEEVCFEGNEAHVGFNLLGQTGSYGVTVSKECLQSFDDFRQEVLAKTGILLAENRDWPALVKKAADAWQKEQAEERGQN